MNLSIHTQNITRAWGLFHLSKLIPSKSYSVPTDKTKKYLEDSLSIARNLNDHDCLSRVYCALSLNELFNNNYNSAQSLLEQSLFEARLAKNNRSIGAAIFQQARLAYFQFDYKSAHLLFEESLILVREVGDLGLWALGVSFLGMISVDQGEWDFAKKYFEEALALAEEARDRSFTSCYLTSLGDLALGIGDFHRSFSLLSRARNLVEDTSDDEFLPAILINLGDVARFQGDFDEASKLYKKAISLPINDGEKWLSWRGLSVINRILGQISEAKNSLMKALQSSRDGAGWAFSAPALISHIAYLAIDQQLTRQAVCLFGWVDNWNKTRGSVEYPVRQAEFDRYLAQAREGLSESEFNATWAEGQSMSQEQILALAKEVLQ